MSKYADIWERLDDEEKEHFLTQVCTKYRWKQYVPRYSKHGIESEEDLKQFACYVLNQGEDEIKYRPKNLRQEAAIQVKKKESEIENSLYHNQPYWYDKSRDVYVVHLPSKKRPYAINGSFWRSMKESYSNWGGSPSSVNEVSRKFNLPRNTVTELLRVMGVTHDSSPWSEEHLATADEEELVQDLIRRKEEHVLVRAQKKEWRKIKKDAEKYRNYHLFAKSLRESMMEVNKVDYHVPKLALAKTDNCFSLVLSPTDFHWGKYAPEYTGDPYNREIAKNRLFKSTREVLSRVSIRGRPEKIFLALGGDGLHIDNMQRGTTRGTPQDCDSTPAEMIASYMKMSREYIDYVRQFAEVDIFVVNGNHDYYSCIFLREALDGWYNCISGVNVIKDLGHRQTFLYGKSLITFVHGDTGKVKDYPAVIAAENAELWGKSQWRFIFTGHLHTERELPVFGDTVVYRMPSLAGTDDWHFQKGYNSRKALVGYVIDKERGVVATEISPVGKGD